MAEPSITQIPSGAYVYAIQVDGVVRYYGKGRGRRAWDHTKIAARLIAGSAGTKHLKRSKLYKNLVLATQAGSQIVVQIIRDGMSDEDAFALEQDCILATGRCILWNSSPGGEGQQSEYLREILNRPEIKEVFRQKTKAAWDANPNRKDARFAEPGSRERQSEMMRQKWLDPDYRDRQIASRSVPRPERRGKKVPALSAPAKARWADPEFKKFATDRLRDAASKPERSERISDGLKASWNNPEHREKRIAGMKRAWAERLGK